METKNILFICKYNRFRSKVAEAYFKKINKNKNLSVKSAGVIEVNKPLTPKEKNRSNYIKNKFNLSISPKSRGLDVTLLEKQDKIIIIADDIPKKIFDNWRWKDKVTIWKIRDEMGDNKKNIDKIVKFIKKKVDKLVKDLEVAKK